jgi:hypothetical protein
MRKRAADRYWNEQIANLKAEVRALKSSAVRVSDLTVTAVDTANSTFTVQVLGPNGVVQDLSGLSSGSQLMPEVGDVAQIATFGAQPVYQPRTIAANAITSREISPNSVSEENLTFSIADIGGTTVYYGPAQPSGAVLIGDLWVQVTDPGPPAQHQTFRWNGTAWQLLADQKVTQALLDAANAQSSADTAAGNAANALVNASSAASAASTAQTTANAKNKSFSQTTAPTTAQGLTVGDEWIDTDDGSKRYYWNGTAWTTTFVGAAAISATARQLGSVATYRQATAPTGTLIVGDLWIDSDDNSLYQYTATGWVASQDTGIQQALTNAATAQTAATTAQASANTKTTTFYQISQPAITGRVVGDMWVDTDDGNKIYTWSGTAWAATLFAAQALNVTARQLGSVTTYRQAAAPTGTLIVGDLWIDTDDNKLYQYTATGWVASQDTGIAQALTNASTAQTTANAKTTTFYQISQPVATGRVIGDMWVDTDDGNKIYTWDGTAWTATLFSAQALNVTARQLGSITTYRQAAAPTGTLVAGDLWIDTDDNKLYQYVTTPTAGWTASQDIGIQQALTNASTAQSTANIKTTTFYQISQPAATGRTAGDLWVDTDDGNKIYTWSGTAWTATLFAAQALNVTARQLGAITIYRQISQPVSAIAGDYWLDSDDGNKPYLYDGTTWTIVQDQQVITALNNAATAQATADTKVRIFPQASAPTGLTAADVGDEWMDTDDSNKIYVWDDTGTVQRTNYFLNPSFEADAAGTVTAPLNWTNSFGGTTGARAVTIVASGATYGTKVARITGATLSTLNTSYIGFSQVIPVVPGDVVTVSAFNLAYTVVSANQRPEFLIEWLNASNAVISSIADTARTNMAAAATRTILTYTTTAAPALTATARITLRRRGMLTTGGTNVANADMSIDAMMLEKNRPTNSPTTYFDGSTGGEARWDTPAAPNSSTSTTWQEGTTGAYAWQPRLIRNNAIQPQSLVASNVVATGTVSAALLEAILVLASVIIAGDPAGTHARMDSTGFRSFRLDPSDGSIDEAVRLGTLGDDILSIINASGRLVGNIDSAGVGNLTNLSTVGDPRFQGTLLSSMINERARGVAWTFDFVNPGATTNEIGLTELDFLSQPGHCYAIFASGLQPDVNGVDFTSCTFRVRMTLDGSIPTITSPTQASTTVHSRFDGAPWEATQGTIIGLHREGNPTSRTVRLLLTLNNGVGAASTALNTDNTFNPRAFFVVDLGVTTGDMGQPNTGGGALVGGGSTVPPAVRRDGETVFLASWVQNFGASGAMSFAECYQGFEASNGNMTSLIGFPDMTASLAGATIRYCKVWVYFQHWWFMDFGIPRIGTHWNLNNPGSLINLHNNQFDGPALGRGAGAWIDCPIQWGIDAQAGNVRGIQLGPGPTTDQHYYGYATGPAQVNPPSIAIGWTR